MKRMTKVQRKLVQRITNGEKLRVQLSDPPYFIDGDAAVNSRTVKTLMAAGILKAAGDGLFDGDTQTLVLA